VRSLSCVAPGRRTRGGEPNDHEPLAEFMSVELNNVKSIQVDVDISKWKALQFSIASASRSDSCFVD
jgi:hypothetical protein